MCSVFYLGKLSDEVANTVILGKCPGCGQDSVMTKKTQSGVYVTTVDSEHGFPTDSHPDTCVLQMDGLLSALPKLSVEQISAAR